MTGPTIKSRSFSLLAAALALYSHAALAVATGPKLPVIQQVGVVPVQWEGGESAAMGLEPVRPAIDEAFPWAVREAHRFHVLSDDLVNGLWQEADGRQELVDQFELHSFAMLTVSPRSDTVIWTARLLDPTLKSQLLETDTVPRPWLAAADADAIRERLQKLVFRLVNRIPVDVSVTSIQGQFITLSGGSEQGIQVGDLVDLVRATIASLHPANGTWLEFHKSPLGTAQVIEAKGFTAVARLVKLTTDNGVEIGDGARIGAIAGRQKFARLAQDGGLRDSGEQASIVVPPLYLGTPPVTKSTPAAKPVAVAQNDQPASDATPQPVAASGSGSGEDGTGSAPAPAEAKPAAPPADSGQPEPKSFWDKVGGAFNGTANTVEGAVGAVIDRPFDDMRIYAGPTWWTISGKDPGLNGQGKFPIWLLNSIGGGITRATVAKFRVAFGGGGAFGKTPGGSWYGYNGYAGIYWEDSFGTDPAAALSTWRAGGQANLSGMGVDHAGSASAPFGGGDWIRGGMIGGLGGRIDAGDAKRFDWFGDFALYPLNIGRVGVRGSFQLVQSTFGYGLTFGAYQYDPMPGIRFGAEVDYNDEIMTLKSGLRAHLNNYSIKALAKYPLP